MTTRDVVATAKIRNKIDLKRHLMKRANRLVTKFFIFICQSFLD